MTFKQAIIASLDRPALSALARDLQVPEVDASHHAVDDDGLRAALDACPGLTFERLMGYLRKDALVEICRVVGLSHSGTRRDLEQRLSEFQQRGMQ